MPIDTQACKKKELETMVPCTILSDCRHALVVENESRERGAPVPGQRWRSREWSQPVPETCVLDLRGCEAHGSSSSSLYKVWVSQVC